MKKTMETINCIVCGNNSNFSTYLKGTKVHPNYLKCSTCGFVFAYPLVPISYKDQSENFWHKGDVALSGRLANYEIRLDAINKYLDEGKHKFLDVGTHTGIFLKLLKSKGIEAVGVELNENAAKYGRQEFGVNILTDPLDKMSERGPFDVITLFNVFEHFENPVTALLHLKALTKTNGILAMEIPNIFTLQSTISRGLWHHFVTEHFWFYDRKTIAMLLRKHGFTVQESFYVSKVVTIAWVLYLLGNISRIFYLFPKLARWFPNSRIYKILDKKIVKINIADYLFVIARREGD